MTAQRLLGVKKLMQFDYFFNIYCYTENVQV